jgi:hypothetical protein
MKLIVNSLIKLGILKKDLDYHLIRISVLHCLETKLTKEHLNMVTTTEKLTGKTAVITGGMKNSAMLSRRAIQS